MLTSASEKGADGSARNGANGVRSSAVAALWITRPAPGIQAGLRQAAYAAGRSLGSVTGSAGKTASPSSDTPAIAAH